MSALKHVRRTLAVALLVTAVMSNGLVAHAEGKIGSGTGNVEEPPSAQDAGAEGQNLYAEAGGVVIDESENGSGGGGNSQWTGSPCAALSAPTAAAST
ncbi:hypothetical protein OG946_11925 [Streptomyces sp. NBC_01808]|uniref:hypothetical protein n=1 Tax=Streptomyces sp. NBC_01808 TaxID=2975947 RepID=UPI002DDC3435|nr:hypothetical protein [Streptomyces sp. NBC_01808]WSA38025.1 hypothetical protein OG946_11925 [Streptomyces sp. NBC_01808]